MKFISCKNRLWITKIPRESHFRNHIFAYRIIAPNWLAARIVNNSYTRTPLPSFHANDKFNINDSSLTNVHESDIKVAIGITCITRESFRSTDEKFNINKLITGRTKTTFVSSNKKFNSTVVCSISKHETHVFPSVCTRCVRDAGHTGTEVTTCLICFRKRAWPCTSCPKGRTSANNVILAIMRTKMLPVNTRLCQE